MKVREFLELFSHYNPETELMILDGFNGGGLPRTINYGPAPLKITEDHARECGDCEGMVGADVVVIGYGCY